MHVVKEPDWRKVLQIIFFIIAITLSACGSSEAQPTQDVNVFYTAAAQTIVVQLSAEAPAPSQEEQVQTPSSSPLDSIPPPPPLLTASAEANQAAPLGGATVPPPPPIPQDTTLPPQNTQTTPIIPTLANTPSGSTQTADKCTYVSQDPPDGLIYSTNFSFDASWSLQNSGSTTWNKLYRLVWYNVQGSDRIGAGLPTQYFLTNTVAPGETYRAIADMKTGITPGKYTSMWALQNAEGISFCFFTLEVIIQSP
ncbi:MAG: hypothetical protein HPY45_10185 [Anaerolineae bacterium]|nr:hypothetical protein [Anaerolineae bacterium]